jgi:hypothetical protein
MLIGAPTVAKMEPLPKEVIDQMIKQMDKAFEQGLPAQQPAAVPSGLVAQMLKTIQFLEAELNRIAALLPEPEEEEEDENQIPLFTDILDPSKMQPVEGEE